MTDATIATAAAIVTLAVNGAAAAYAGWRWWQVLAGGGVWPLIRAGQLAAVAQAVTAGALFVSGYHPAGRLYYLYVGLPIAIGVIAEQLRIASADQILERRDLPDAQAVGTLPQADQRSVVLAIVRREIGVMALAAFVVAVLALRAALLSGS